MTQALHIFRKDVHHLRLDLAAYAALLVAFGIVSPQLREAVLTPNFFAVTFGTLLKFLLPMCWLFLITRAMHNESLIGDQQFWITRPYRWPSLLAAKLLFVVVCVMLPFLVVQGALLLHAHLNPFAAMPGLLVTLLMYALAIWLPIVVAAALTATVAQVFIALVAVILLWISILTAIIGVIGPRTTPPGVLQACAVVCGLLLLGTLLYQYATRDSRRARLTFVVAATGIILLYGATEIWNSTGPMDVLTRTVYADSGSAHLSFDSSVNHLAVKRTHSALTESLTAITLPIQVLGLPTTDRLFEPSATYTLDTSGGRYTAPWRPTSINTNGISLLIPADVLQGAGAGTVILHLSIAATRLAPGTPQIITATHRFSIPGGGNCQLNEGMVGNNTTCRYPFGNETSTLVSGRVIAGSCSEPGAPKDGLTTLGSRPSFTREDPVVQIPLYLGGSVCPGTQLTMVPYRQIGNLRLELDAKPVDLSSYRDQ